MSSWSFLLLWNKLEGKFVHIRVKSDPYEQRMDRLYRRLDYNVDKLNLLMTLTYVDNTKGYYPIVDRALSKDLPWYLGLPKNARYYRFEGKDTLFYINYNYDGLTGHIRLFFNKIQQYFKRVYGCSISYFWVLEVGGKNKRPHVHVVLGISETLPLMLIWDIFESKWNSGYVDLMEIESKSHISGYLSKYLSGKNPSDSMYVKKGHRSWSCSRDIKSKPKDGIHDYCGIYESLNEIYEIEGLYVWNELNKKFESKS